MNSKSLLMQVVSLPTAPLQEWHVIRFVEQFAAAHGLRCRADAFGNLWLGNGARGRPRLTVMAHLDHPAVRIVRRHGPGRFIAQVRGGLNVPQVTKTRWIFYPRRGAPVKARSVGLVDAKRKWLTIAVAPADGAALHKGAFGMLDIPPARATAKLLHARVIDNLAGCGVILDWLRGLRRSRIPVQAIFTRGEEIGFAGAARLVRSNTLPLHTPLIVLETSNAAVARVEIGGGPVLRVGDRLHSFDPQIECWLRHTADALTKSSPGFRYQRALMTGGAMEASLYCLAGAQVGALILPLGNYHNRGPRGPAPEYIAWDDLFHLRRWLDALVTAPPVRTVVARARRALLRHALAAR